MERSLAEVQLEHLPEASQVPTNQDKNKSLSINVAHWLSYISSC